jgi:hypothetical protein
MLNTRISERMSLLSAPVALHDVRNLEKLMRSELDLRLKQKGGFFIDLEYEDALSYFIGRAWELSLEYDDSRGWSFSKLCRDRSRWWYTDFLRQRFGDSRYGNNFVTVELDERDQEELAEEVEWAEVLATINTAVLSPLARRTLARIAVPLTEGKDLNVIAIEQGKRAKDLKDDLDKLRREIETKCLLAA